VEVFVGKKRAHALAEPTWDNQKLPKVTPEMPIGANVYDRIGVEDKRPGYLYVVAKGPQPIELRVSKKIKLTQKLEVGEQEFVYKKGSQGLVRNIALLLNIPESRIKVVGLGSMKDGEIWGKHNGVEKYTPPSLLQTGSKPELMQVVIDPAEVENEDEADVIEHELTSVFKDTKNKCTKGDIKCNKDPEIDSIPVPGWECDAGKYGTGDGCDCDCGIWDPDCDAESKFGYGVVNEEGEMRLLDTARVEALLKGFDTKPKDHAFGNEEILNVNRSLATTDPLRILAHEIHHAGKNYVPLLKMAPESTCGDGKKCLMNPKKPLTPKALPSGVCVKSDKKEKGSGCASKPCGECGEVKCVPDDQNSWGYKCVPSSEKVAIMTKSDGKFMEWYHQCRGRRRWKRCSWTLVPRVGVVGKSQWRREGYGVCKGPKLLKTIRSARSLSGCQAEAAKLGAKTFSRKTRYHRRSKQPCYIYDGFCTGKTSSSWRTNRHWHTYELADRKQTFVMRDTGDGHFQLASGLDSKVCLAQHKDGNLIGSTCNDKYKDQRWELSLTCRDMGSLSNVLQKKCIQSAKGDVYGSHACDAHIPEQKISFVQVSDKDLPPSVK